MDFFVVPDRSGTEEDVVEVSCDEVEGNPLPDGYELLQDTAEYIAMMEGMRFDVDCNNRPAPENIPGNDDEQQEEAENNDGLSNGQSWGWDGLYDCRSNSSYNFKSKLRGISDISLF